MIILPASLAQSNLSNYFIQQYIQMDNIMDEERNVKTLQQLRGELEQAVYVDPSQTVFAHLQQKKTLLRNDSAQSQLYRNFIMQQKYHHWKLHPSQEYKQIYKTQEKRLFYSILMDHDQIQKQCSYGACFAQNIGILSVTRRLIFIQQSVNQISFISAKIALSTWNKEHNKQIQLLWKSGQLSRHAGWILTLLSASQLTQYTDGLNSMYPHFIVESFIQITQLLRQQIAQINEVNRIVQQFGFKLRLDSIQGVIEKFIVVMQYLTVNRDILISVLIERSQTYFKKLQQFQTKLSKQLGRQASYPLLDLIKKKQIPIDYIPPTVKNLIVQRQQAQSPGLVRLCLNFIKLQTLKLNFNPNISEERYRVMIAQNLDTIVSLISLNGKLLQRIVETDINLDKSFLKFRQSFVASVQKYNENTKYLFINYSEQSSLMTVRTNNLHTSVFSLSGVCLYGILKIFTINQENAPIRQKLGFLQSSGAKMITNVFAQLYQRQMIYYSERLRHMVLNQQRVNKEIKDTLAIFQPQFTVPEQQCFIERLIDTAKPIFNQHSEKVKQIKQAITTARLDNQHARVFSLITQLLSMTHIYTANAVEQLKQGRKSHRELFKKIKKHKELIMKDHNERQQQIQAIINKLSFQNNADAQKVSRIKSLMKQQRLSALSKSDEIVDSIRQRLENDLVHIESLQKIYEIELQGNNDTQKVQDFERLRQQIGEQKNNLVDKFLKQSEQLHPVIELYDKLATQRIVQNSANPADSAVELVTKQNANQSAQFLNLIDHVENNGEQKIPENQSLNGSFIQQDPQDPVNENQMPLNQQKNDEILLSKIQQIQRQNEPENQKKSKLYKKQLMQISGQLSIDPVQILTNMKDPEISQQKILTFTKKNDPQYFGIIHSVAKGSREGKLIAQGIDVQLKKNFQQSSENVKRIIEQQGDTARYFKALYFDNEQRVNEIIKSMTKQLMGYDMYGQIKKTLFDTQELQIKKLESQIQEQAILKTITRIDEDNSNIQDLIKILTEQFQNQIKRVLSQSYNQMKSENVGDQDWGQKKALAAINALQKAKFSQILSEQENNETRKSIQEIIKSYTQNSEKKIKAIGLKFINVVKRQLKDSHSYLKKQLKTMSAKSTSQFQQLQTKVDNLACQNLIMSEQTAKIIKRQRKRQTEEIKRHMSKVFLRTTPGYQQALAEIVQTHQGDIQRLKRINAVIKRKNIQVKTILNQNGFDSVQQLLEKYKHINDKIQEIHIQKSLLHQKNEQLQNSLLIQANQINMTQQQLQEKLKAKQQELRKQIQVKLNQKQLEVIKGIGEQIFDIIEYGQKQGYTQASYITQRIQQMKNIQSHLLSIMFQIKQQLEDDGYMGLKARAICMKIQTISQILNQQRAFQLKQLNSTLQQSQRIRRQLQSDISQKHQQMNNILDKIKNIVVQKYSPAFFKELQNQGVSEATRKLIMSIKEQISGALQQDLGNYINPHEDFDMAAGFIYTNNQLLKKYQRDVEKSIAREQKAKYKFSLKQLQDQVQKGIDLTKELKQTINEKQKQITQKDDTVNKLNVKIKEIEQQMKLIQAQKYVAQSLKQHTISQAGARIELIASLKAQVQRLKEGQKTYQQVRVLKNKISKIQQQKNKIKEQVERKTAQYNEKLKQVETERKDIQLLESQYNAQLNMFNQKKLIADAQMDQVLKEYEDRLRQGKQQYDAAMRINLDLSKQVQQHQRKILSYQAQVEISALQNKPNSANLYQFGVVNQHNLQAVQDALQHKQNNLNTTQVLSKRNQNIARSLTCIMGAYLKQSLVLVRGLQTIQDQLNRTLVGVSQVGIKSQTLKNYENLIHTLKSSINLLITQASKFAVNGSNCLKEEFGNIVTNVWRSSTSQARAQFQSQYNLLGLGRYV